MVLFYTWMFFPFGGLIIVSGLQSLDPMVEEAAQLCGATRIQVFFRVTIPLLATNIVTATILIFLQAFGAFSIPLIAGGNHHPLAVQIFTVATVFLQWHRASALAVVMGGIQIILLSLNGWLSRRGRYASTTTR
jgi:ABC-type Fe3+ transport system permease subunit